MTGIGFVGLGRMGYHLASRLHHAGHSVMATDLSEAARSRMESAGVTTVPSVTDLAGCSVVMSSLPATADVEDVYLGALIALLEPDSVCVDLSTISVEGSVNVAAAAAHRGIAFLDAPVSGTSIHAEAGTLAIMVGGPLEALERARPLLESFAGTITHMGANGKGLEMKLITNRLLTAHVVAIGEAIVEMEQAGLDVASSLELLRSGAVPRLLDYKARPMAERDYRPLFTVGLMSKDLRLAAERRSAGPVIGRAVESMLAAEGAGLGSEDIAAVMEIIQREVSD
jgi:3-hydroxyisobutyrate dehydrogenase